MSVKQPSAELQPLASAQQGQPEWLRSMQEHYQQKGYFRAEDVARVLGDPRDSVDLLNANLPLAARLQK